MTKAALHKQTRTDCGDETVNMMPPSSQAATPRRQRRRRRSQRRTCLAVITAVTASCCSLAVTVVSAEEEECQRGTNGWAASSDCKTYFWCSHGARSSITYSCVEGQLFDISKAACSHGYSCPEAVVSTTTTTTTSTAQAYPQPQPQPSPSNNDNNNDQSSPTAHPTKLGRPAYFGDFRTTACQNINDLQSPPEWVTDEYLFRSKEECCLEMFNWQSLDNCLGAGFVETNYVIGSRSPTQSPTFTPTNMPSLSPSLSSMPSSEPSGVPSNIPSMMPSMSPSIAGSSAPSTTSSPSSSSAPTSVATLAPTPPTPAVVAQKITQYSEEASSSSTTTNTNHNAANDYLVELIGWANADMDTLYPEGSTVVNPTPSPVAAEDQISELILSVAADATLSQNRPDANFGANTALAVDGGSVDAAGDSLGERFDSLLKFDLSMIDSTRDIESAVLRIYALTDCLGGTFTTTVDSDWSQDEVTWDTSPSKYGGVMFGVLKEVRKETWYEFDISSALNWHENLSLDGSNGQFLSVRMTSSENSRCLYPSMESGGSKTPFIAVKYLAQESVGYVIDDPGPKPAPGQFVLLLADADSTISASEPTTNLANKPSLKVEFNPVTRNIHDTVIRFDVSQLRGVVPRAAILSLFSEMDCSSAGTFATTATTPWDESTVIWTNSPNYVPGDPYTGGVMIGTFGAVSANRWYGFDVVPAIRIAMQAKKTEVTFRISSGNTGTCQYSSKESGREPKMMVSF